MTVEDGSARPGVARVGITLLNLLAPGLGLLRLGRLRLALLLLLAPFLLIGVAILLYRILPDLDLSIILSIAIAAALLSLVAYGFAMVRSWRVSSQRILPLPWYAQAHVLVVVGMMHWLCWFVLTADRDMLSYRSFWVPSVAMAPTLMPNDTFLARMRAPDGLRRGQVVLHQMGGSIYIKRVAGLPGDRIGLRGGIVVLNGAEVPQRATDLEANIDESGLTAKELVEQFPGEAGTHRIWDTQTISELDDFPEITVPDGHLFLLGDNRDNSADSRLSVANQGSGFVPISAIRGYALFHLWSGGSQPAGTWIND